MNSPKYENLAWLQVQDVPRGTEDGRLATTATMAAKVGLRVVRALAGFTARRAGATPPASLSAESRHHA
jgi:hypothetical protein